MALNILFVYVFTQVSKLIFCAIFVNEFCKIVLSGLKNSAKLIKLLTSLQNSWKTWSLPANTSINNEKSQRKFPPPQTPEITFYALINRKHRDHGQVRRVGKLSARSLRRTGDKSRLRRVFPIFRFSKMDSLEKSINSATGDFHHSHLLLLPHSFRTALATRAHRRESTWNRRSSSRALSKSRGTASRSSSPDWRKCSSKSTK